MKCPECQVEMQSCEAGMFCDNNACGYLDGGARKKLPHAAAPSPGNRDDLLTTIRNAVKLARTYGDNAGAINVIEAALAAPVALGNREQALRKGLSWRAVAKELFDSLDMGGFRWDKILSEQGKRELTTTVKRIIKTALAASEPASQGANECESAAGKTAGAVTQGCRAPDLPQGAKAEELDVLSWLKENFPYTWATFNTGHHDAVRAAYAAGRAAQPPQPGTSASGKEQDNG